MAIEAGLALVGLNIGGEWNLPLLANAAALSGASNETALENDFPPESLQKEATYILACETGRRSRNIYEFPAPRKRTAVIVGNELTGVPKHVLSAADGIVSIPMRQARISSINVAAAAAVCLYILEKDLARKGVRQSDIDQADADLLLAGPDDSSEIGSLLRSAWAFGWQKVYLEDPKGVWFTKDRALILAGRAAARSEKNPVIVVPAERLDVSRYDAVFVCDGGEGGTPLSRMRLPRVRKLLAVYGPSEIAQADAARITVDFTNKNVVPRYRLAGSVFLSYLSQCLREPKRHG